MNKTEFIQIIREVVKKEVRSAIREELQRYPIQESQKQPMRETKKPLSSMLGAAPKVKKLVSTGNVLEDLINETAQSDWRSLGNFTSADAPNFQSINNQSFEIDLGKTKPSTVESMLNNAPKVASPEMIQSVVEVPDFTAMMSTMKTKGLL
jgi:hypothetical protein